MSYLENTRKYEPVPSSRRPIKQVRHETYIDLSHQPDVRRMTSSLVTSSLSPLLTHSFGWNTSLLS